MGKRTKAVDRDKYYRLAKDQGYRARSAFKLIEINKKYDFLGSAKVVIDLCAAPGGWCQVAAKHMPSGGVIIGVDLLPIRAIPNVKTLEMDITTEECRVALKREMQGWKADAVMCDGAPNVGAAYNKDAFVQNEIALAALKVATQQLRKGGTFVTKVYRSQDYNALMWVVQQFFDSHQAVKPASSRSQSAEIFVVGRGFKAPDSVDPRLLDPRHVFEQDFEEGAKKGLTIFHKKFDQHNKRQRQGYDDDLGMTLSRKASVSSFVDAEDPVRMLTDAHVLHFTPACRVYREHSATTADVLHACQDLRVLGKGDFRSLIRWRLRLREYRDKLRAGAEAQEGATEEGQGEDEEEAGGEKKTEEEEEEEVQAEIRSLQMKALAERKRERKRDRLAAARLRQRVAMGMESHRDHADLPQGEDEDVFSLATIQTGTDLETVREVDLEKSSVPMDSDQDEKDGDDDNDEEEEESGDEQDLQRLQAEMDEAYTRYLSGKNDEKKEGTRLAKRTKKAKQAKAAEEAMQDSSLYDGDQAAYLEMLAGDADPEDISRSSSDDDGDDDDIGGADAPSSDEEQEDQPQQQERGGAAAAMAAAAGRRAWRLRRGGASAVEAEDPNPLLGRMEAMAGGTSANAAAARWFSDPLFQGVDEQAPVENADDDEEEEGGKEGDAPERPDKMRKRARREDEQQNGTVLGASSDSDTDGGEGDGDGRGVAAELIRSMPKTDKQLRQEKRRKLVGRKERREQRSKRRLGEEPEDLQVVAADDALEHMSKEEQARVQRKRDLIHAGMGAAVASAGAGTGSGGVAVTAEVEDSPGFEVAKAAGAAAALRGGTAAAAAAAARPRFAVPGLAVADDRAYGSDDEDYDPEDRARQLALGTMMLRTHRAKELVDAAYNRFSWNDDADLPDWFMDDEKKHYRPQVPIPPALMEQMRQKFLSLATKPVKKVAEARARKRKRAVTRLRAAKKKAESLASNPDVSEREKLRAVQQMMKKGMRADKPSKVYVVSRGGGRGSGGAAAAKKGGAKVKMVDSRMRSDTRGMKRAEAKRKGGAKAARQKGRRGKQKR